MDHFIGQAARGSRSLVVESKLLGRDRTRLQSDLMALAQCVCQVTRMAGQSLCRGLLNLIDHKVVRSLAAHRAKRYDETPTRISVTDSVESLQSRSRAAAESPQTAKVLQSEASGAFLVEFKGRRYLIDMPCFATLAALDRGTAETMEVGLSRNLLIPGLSDTFEKFPVEHDVSCSDRGAANRRYDKDAARSTRSRSRLMLDCDAHKGFASAAAQFSCISHDVSGLVNVGTLMRGAGSMSSWRQTVATWVEARVRIFKGVTPPPQSMAALHKEAVLALFSGSQKPASRFLREFLIKHLNGDSRVRGELQHYCPDGCCDGSPLT